MKKSNLIKYIIGFIIVIVIVIILIVLLGKSSDSKKTSDKDTTSQKTTTTKEQTTTEPEATTEDETTSQKKLTSEEFFSDAVFIGDSRTEGLMMYTELGEYSAFYSKVGLNITKALEEPFVKLNGSEVTILEALKEEHFSKIYIMLGFNELGWPNDYIFIEKYQTLIDEIQKLQPNATIYLESILHVTAEHSKTEEYENNKRINMYNKNIKALANGSNVKYIDLNPCFDDKNHTLKKDSTTDGIHLKAKYYDIWKDYLFENP